MSNDLMTWPEAIRQIQDNVEAKRLYALHCVRCHDDLLEALKEAEQIITMAVSGEWETPDYEGVLLKVSAAIKKAEAQS